MVGCMLKIGVPHFQHLSTVLKMPIDLKKSVERVLVTRLKQTAFDVWRYSLARRKHVVARMWENIEYNGDLVRAVLRFWAGR